MAEHSHVALSLLVGEARRVDRVKPGRDAGDADRRWRSVGREALRALRTGADPAQARAEFAGRFPFLGLVTTEELDACRERQRRVIDALRDGGRLFLPELPEADGAEFATLRADTPPAPPPPQRRDAPPAAPPAEEAPLLAPGEAPCIDVDISAALTAITAAVTAASAASGGEHAKEPRRRGDVPAPASPPCCALPAPAAPNCTNNGGWFYALPAPSFGGGSKTCGWDELSGCGGVTTSRLFTRWSAEVL